VQIHIRTAPFLLLLRRRYLFCVCGKCTRERNEPVFPFHGKHHFPLLRFCSVRLMNVLFILPQDIFPSLLLSAQSGAFHSLHCHTLRAALIARLRFNFGAECFNYCSLCGVSLPSCVGLYSGNRVSSESGVSLLSVDAVCSN